jgi:DNA-binding Lrp family transcriptional regulator
MTIDRLDARLIATLREYPRVGLLEVARRIGVARGTVQARLAKLEASGVITGHGPEIDTVALGYPISAFVEIELAQGRLAEALAVIEAVPEVLEVDAVSGPHDLICRVVARDTGHLGELINDLLARRRSAGARATSCSRATCPPDGAARAAAGERAPTPRP